MLAREYGDTETLRTLELEREKLPQTLPPITLTKQRGMSFGPHRLMAEEDKPRNRP